MGWWIFRAPWSQKPSFTVSSFTLGLAGVSGWAWLTGELALGPLYSYIGLACWLSLTDRRA